MSTRTILFTLILLAACGGGASHAFAQQQLSSQAQAPATTNDLEITANVTARELRFEVVPEPKVEFTGQPRRETVWEAERQNLPRPVEPGVTYRNIGIQLKITSRFADIDRIVAEALGEVPVTDDVQEKPSAPLNNAPPPATPSPSSQEGKP